MKKDQIETEAFKDQDAIRLMDGKVKFLSYEPEKLVIMFSFRHEGFHKEHYSTGLQRICLRVMNKDNLCTFCPLIPIKLTTRIHVNSAYPDQALTYLLTVDSIIKKVTLNILDMPQINRRWLTDEELNGIEIFYQKLNRNIDG